MPTSRDTSIEPKSEYLREALNSRKAKNPSPVNPLSQPATPIEHPGDEWAANAEEEDASGNDTSKRRYRRASEVKEQRPTPTRKFTLKEMDSKKDQIEKSNFDLGLRICLLEQHNAKIQKELEEALEKIKAFEGVEDENEELREENDQLRLKTQGLEEDLAAKHDEYAELLSINEELVTEMEKRDAGLEEAADMIYRLEIENVTLKERVANCKAAIGGNGESDYYSTEPEADSPRKRASDLWSIPESRPSTGQRDSDYYSQPPSPQVPATKPQSNSKPVGPYSARARTLIRTTSHGSGSVNELRKRMSLVSVTEDLKSEVVAPLPTQSPTLRSSPRISGRFQIPVFGPADLRLKLDPPTESRPATPIPDPGLGLRDLYKNSATIKSPQLLESRESSNRSFKDKIPGHSEDACSPPSRTSSKFFTRPAPAYNNRVPSPTASLETEYSTTEPERPPGWWKEYQQWPSPGNRNYGTGGRDFMFNANEDVEEFAARTRSFGKRR